MDSEALQLIIDMIRRDVIREYQWIDIWHKQTDAEFNQMVRVIHNEDEHLFKMSHFAGKGKGVFTAWNLIGEEVWIDSSVNALSNAAERAQSYWVTNCEVKADA